MHAIQERYCEITRVFLKILGLWPYEQTYFALAQKVLFASILLTFIIVQVF